MINCTRKPYSPLSCHNPFVFLLKHIVFYHIVIYDFLQKMRDFLIPSFSPASLLLFEVTDFYVYMLSQGVCIFFQYYKRRNPASALESRQIRWQHSHNVCDLQEVTVEEGDYVETGAVIGHVAEPTKYYSVEGSNVYFKLTKDGEAVNPLDYLG